MVNNPTAHGVWNSMDAAMWCHIIAPDGRRITHEVATKREKYFSSALEHLRTVGFEIHQQSSAELKALTKLMHERTLDITCWRMQCEAPPRGRPNTLKIPARVANGATYVLFPDLAPVQGKIELASKPA